MPLLEVNDLQVHFHTRKGVVKAVNGVSFCMEEGKTLGIVGESGSGKSVTAMSLLRLLDGNGYIEGGEIWFDGEGGRQNLATLPKEKMYSIRGNQISVIFQEPMTALNPVFSIGRQLSEPFLLHQMASKKGARERGLSMLGEVGISDAERVWKGYPHQLSGGMRQRVMIAMALACRPKILIADEPTTALDVTIQAQILRLMKGLQKSNQTAILFITHDLGVIRQMADDVAVMYCGQVVERAPAPVLFSGDGYSHPYTEGLLSSIPSAKNAGKRLPSISGNVPHPLRLPTGCKFSPRCPYRQERCKREEPALMEVATEHFVRCFYPQKRNRIPKEEERI